MWRGSKLPRQTSTPTQFPLKCFAFPGAETARKQFLLRGASSPAKKLPRTRRTRRRVRLKCERACGPSRALPGKRYSKPLPTGGAFALPGGRWCRQLPPRRRFRALGGGAAREISVRRHDVSLLLPLRPFGCHGPACIQSGRRSCESDGRSHQVFELLSAFICWRCLRSCWQAGQ